MKTSIILGTDKYLSANGFRPMIEVARIADEIGVDVVTVPEHLAMTTNNAEFVARYGENPPVDDQTLFPEPMVFLSAIAAATKSIRVGTSIILSPLRPALVLAKQIATLDYMSGGRTLFGLGAGWQKEEFGATNMPWDDRLAHLFEQVGAFRALWSEAPASFHGDFINFDELNSLPFPAQGKDVPLFLGIRSSAKNVKRMAELGVGWMPMPTPPEELVDPISRLREAYRAAGRSVADLNVLAFSAVPLGPSGVPDLDRALALIPQYAEIGVSTLCFAPAGYCGDVQGHVAVIEKIERAVKG